MSVSHQKSNQRAGSGSQKRRGQIGIRILVAIAVVCGVGGVGYVSATKFSSATTSDDILLHEVSKTTLEILVMERGALESADNRDLVCEIEARNPGSPATSIKWIVEEGHIAKEGDLLVEFDSASIRDQVTQQKLKAEQANAQLTTAQADLEITKSQNQSDIDAAKITVELAEIDLEKYVKGDYIKEKRTIEGNILIAEEELKRAQERLLYSQRLLTKGFVSESDVESDQLAVTRADNNLKIAKEELRVLDQYTKPRTVKDLQSLREESKRALDRVKSQAKAKEAQVNADLLAKELTYNTEMNLLTKLESQLEKCKLFAPSNGLVTYANQPGRFGRSELQIEEGASIRERQKVIRLPDLNNMQVNVKVHEAKVGWLTIGQEAKIRVESMPDQWLNGRVKSVATMADSQSWMSTGVQVFTVIVSIEEGIEGLKPGMTAEVEVLCSRKNDVLTVPVQAVIERNSQTFCYVQDGRGYELKTVQLGDSNDKFVIVESGLEAGHKVVQNVEAVLTEDVLLELTEATKEGANGKKGRWEGAAAPPSPGAAAGNGAGRKPKGKGRSKGPQGAGPSRKPGGAGGAGGGGGGGGGDFMTRFDTDGDGKLAGEELEKAFFLKRYDTNSDGVLDQSEIEAFRARRKQGGGGSSGGGGPPQASSGGGGGGAGAGDRPTTGAEMIKRGDKNGDGKITKDELEPERQAFFDFMDSNKDGAIDLAEADAMIQRFRQRSQGEGGGF